MDFSRFMELCKSAYYYYYVVQKNSVPQVIGIITVIIGSYLKAGGFDDVVNILTSVQLDDVQMVSRIFQI